MNTRVYSLANKTVCLDRIKSGGETKITPAAARVSRKPHEMDGLVEMLTRVQCSRADDQRGLLTKEQLELPHFLQLPMQQSDECEAESGEQSSSNIHTQPATTGGNEEKAYHKNQKDSNEGKNQKAT